LTWKNVKGGGISLDAFVFALDPAYVPSQTPWPVSGPGVIVLQAEDCTRFISKEGRLPGGDRAAVWLAGDGAGLQDLTLLGDAQVNYGIAVASPQAVRRVADCLVERVRVADCDRKQGENIIAGNTIARQRKPGLFLYANGTTLASSMPRTWNRGISPLFWNLCEGNRVEECSAGALVTRGDESNLPIEFPRALGTVLRHNSFIRSRSDGVVLTSRPTPAGVKDSAASVTGTIVEFNVVRDAQVAEHRIEVSHGPLPHGAFSAC
jgi:hypothetical protein